MNRFTFPLLALGFSLVSFICLADGPDSKQDTESQIKVLQKERIEKLSEVVSIYKGQYSTGSQTVEALLDAQTKLSNAQLDAADNAAERVDLLKEQLKNELDFFKIIEGRFKSGSISEADFCLAKARLLDTKIRLLRETQKLIEKH